MPHRRNGDRLGTLLVHLQKHLVLHLADGQILTATGQHPAEIGLARESHAQPREGFGERLLIFEPEPGQSQRFAEAAVAKGLTNCREHKPISIEM